MKIGSLPRGFFTSGCFWFLGKARPPPIELPLRMFLTQKLFDSPGHNSRGVDTMYVCTNVLWRVISGYIYMSHGVRYTLEKNIFRCVEEMGAGALYVVSLATAALSRVVLGSPPPAFILT